MKVESPRAPEFEAEIPLDEREADFEYFVERWREFRPEASEEEIEVEWQEFLEEWRKESLQ